MKGESDDQVLRFYWLDAYEDQFSQPGNVQLKAENANLIIFVQIFFFRNWGFQA